MVGEKRLRSFSRSNHDPRALVRPAIQHRYGFQESKRLDKRGVGIEGKRHPVRSAAFHPLEPCLFQRRDIAAVRIDVIGAYPSYDPLEPIMPTAGVDVYDDEHTVGKQQVPDFGKKSRKWNVYHMFYAIDG